jgi:hypothetical protein
VDRFTNYQEQTMARKKINVSAAIKDYLAKNADVGPTDAAKAISAEIGKEVSPTYVSNIKTTMAKGGGKKKRRGRKPGSKAAGHSANGSIDLEALMAMKELLGKVGADTARKMIDVLS